MKGSYERKFWQVLEDLFVGAEVEGKGGYINLLKVKRQYFKNYLSPKLREYIQETLKDFPTFKEELYDKLYTFFRRYFSEIGSIMFAYTPLYYKIYEKVYQNDRQELRELITYNTDYEQILSEKQDVALFWKTRNLYYLKTDRIVRSMTVEVDNISFYFDASEVENKRNNEKRSFVYELKEVKDNTVVLKVKYSERGTKTKEEEIIKQAKKQGKPIKEETLKKAIKTFEKQAYVDYFINKNAEKFLKEQFDLWLYQYLFSQETNFTYDRYRQLQALKNVAYRVIEFVAQFEEELKRLWEKPRLVFNSNYVISLDRLASKSPSLFEEVLKSLKTQEQEFKKELEDLKKLKQDLKAYRERLENRQVKNQLEEWFLLDLIEEDFQVEQILQDERFKFLPIDTRYFVGLKEKIEEVFDVFSVEGDLDGWLIKSENWQALNTILPRFKGKVQTIYIDPPFNLETNADFQYEVNYKDATWATMLENRLRLAREFLKDTGSIFVRCDYNGNWIVRPLMDEIFGRENFRNEILINRKRQAIGTPNKFEVESEYLFLYSKSSEYIRKDIYKPRSLINMKWTSFLKQEDRNPRERKFLGKTLYPPKGQHFSLKQEKVDKLLKEHFLRLKCKVCGAIYYYDENDSREGFILKILQAKDKFKYIDITTDTVVFGVKKIDRCLNCDGDDWKVEYLTSNEEKITDNWKDIGSYEDAFNFSTENSEILLKRVIESTSNEGDLVMDFFLGSGTTTAVAHKLKRKWIGIEMGEHFYTVVLPRMKKVLAYDKSGISKEKDVKEKYNEKNAGGFFKYYELEQYEDILRVVEYKDTDVSEYYEKLKDVLGDEFVFSKVDPFVFDLPWQKAVRIEEGDLKIRFEELYPNKQVDIKETLANTRLENQRELLRSFIK